MFSTETLVAVRATKPPATHDEPGMLVRVGEIGGTQNAAPYANDSTSVTIPVTSVGLKEAQSLIRFRFLLPLGSLLGFFRVRPFLTWRNSVASSGACSIRPVVFARILDKDAKVVSTFDVPTGRPGSSHAGQIAAGPWFDYVAPIDPLTPVPFRNGTYFELAIALEVTTASPTPLDTCTVRFETPWPQGDDGELTSCDVDVGSL